jgi:hypothetical protein
LGAELAADIASRADLGRLFEFALQAASAAPPQAESAAARLTRPAFVRFMAPANEFARLTRVTAVAVQRLRAALAGCGLPTRKVVELLAAHAHSARGRVGDEWDKLLTVRGFLHAMAAAGLGARAGLTEADLAFVVAELAGSAGGGMQDGEVTMPVKGVCAMLLESGKPAAPPPGYTPSFQ